MSQQHTLLAKFVAIAVLFSTLRLAMAAGNLVEFSAALQKFEGEGITYQRLVFKDDKRVIYYQPPRGWKCNAFGNLLTLTPADRTFAEAKISSVALDKAVSLDDKAADAFKQQVLSSLPEGSRNAAVVKQEQNGITLNNNSMLEVIVSYDVYGQSFQRSVFLLNTPANQVRFQFTARKADFDALYRQFRESVVTWEWQPESGQANPDSDG